MIWIVRTTKTSIEKTFMLNTYLFQPLLFGIAIWFISSARGLKICASTAGIKKYKPIIKKKNIKHDKIEFLAKVV